MSAIDLRLGRWEDVLADVDEVDALITDPPYSERTHAGHDDGVDSTGRDTDRGQSSKRAQPGRRKLGYEPWTAHDATAFVDAWAPRTRGWMAILTDHTLAPAFAAAMEAADRYVFSPLPYVEPGSRVRLSGDGPACWSCWLLVSRPRTREWQRWRSLPGAYVRPPDLGIEGEKHVMGGKPLWFVRALVRDYSRPGDLVCDPCSGGATTLLAAAIEGRRAVGAEQDPKTYELARKRLARGYTPTMFAEGA